MIIGLILACVLFIVGLAGTILPVLPGAPVILAGMVIYGFFTGFEQFSWVFFFWQTAAVILTFLVDYFANVWGVKKYGGSKAAVWGSIAGMLAGIVCMGPLGVVLGPFIGAAAGELLVRNSPSQALRTGMGTIIGLLGGTAVKIVIEIAMIVWFFMVIF